MTSIWLEQWMPFDVANQAMEENGSLGLEEARPYPGRHGDWRGAIGLAYLPPFDI